LLGFDTFQLTQKSDGDRAHTKGESPRLAWEHVSGVKAGQSGSMWARPWHGAASRGILVNPWVAVGRAGGSGHDWAGEREVGHGAGSTRVREAGWESGASGPPAGN
jgi:hypothetical protein